ncbi:virulence factor [Lactococcus lactis]|uniref:Virulence factor n=1 Tax=Lactococcus lactis TaxID=1358 RepID=A0AAW8UFY2_9LACT|nr:virulence factor [Lactococcus lactis]MDN6835556.1 virulence factor [Lactococcus lactis]MDT2922297.1 virulence factor [Lactococcus lactis]MDT2946426.1 virulence factor [Lactococcus lactis]
MTYLRIYDYPREGLGRMWLKELLQQDHVVSFLAVESLDTKKVEEKAAKSINEKESRIDINGKTTDNNREAQEVGDLLDLIDDMTRKHEKMKGISIRLAVYDLTEDKLMTRVKKIRDEASQFKSTVMLDELYFEQEALFTSPESHDELLNAPSHRPIKSRDLAGGYFLDHTKLEDKTGSYFGKTKTDGVIQLDWLLKNQFRTRPFMLISGTPNMGQGTFSIALIDDNFAQNHFIRNINLDQSPFLNNYTENNLGILIDMAGNRNKINIFQVFQGATNEKGETDEIKSFSLHIAKLKNMFEVLKPDATADDCDVFEDLATAFYCQYPSENNPLWYRNPLLHVKELKATKVPASEYPTLKDFVGYIEGQLVLAKTAEMERSYRRILSTFVKLLNTKPDVFEGTTNFTDLSEEHLVTFDLSGLIGTPDYLNVQLFSVMALISYDVIRNGKKQRQRLKTNPRLLESEVEHYIVNITDIGKMLNPRTPSSSELTLQMIDALSQNYAGIIVQAGSFQTILNSGGSGFKAERYQAAMKSIFGMMNYRVFGQTSSADKQLLADILQEEISPYELDAITTLEQGQLYLNIAGRQSIIFSQDYDSSDLAEYGGWH